MPRALFWEGRRLVLLDQRQLPTTVYMECSSVECVAKGMECLAVESSAKGMRGLRHGARRGGREAVERAVGSSG